MNNPLIFDLDGTLVDSLDGIAASLNRSLSAHGLPGHSHANVRSFIGDGLHTLVRRAAHPGAEKELLDSLARYFKADYDGSWQHGTSAYPGIPDLLDHLQSSGTPLAVLSNKPHGFTVEITRSIFPKINFATVLGQQDGIPHKPDPAGALLIAERLLTPPALCTIIGDSTMDLETAERAGMRSLAVSWGYHDRDRLVAAGAKHIIDNPSDLLHILFHSKP